MVCKKFADFTRLLYLAFPTLESSNNTADEALLMLPTLFNYITIYFRQTLALYRSLL